MPRNGEEMKLKYYMRGIGVGILFSIIVFLIVGQEELQMTEEQIIAAAKELGMEEKKTIDLSGLNPTPITSPGENSDTLDESNNSSKEESGDLEEKDQLPSVTPASDESDTDSLKTGDDKKKEEDTSENSDEPQKDNDSNVDNNDSNVDNNDSTVDNNDTTVDNNDSTVDINGSESDVSSTNGSEVIKTFTISKGMYSHDVADLCESIGLVENAKDFDRYLIQNGYASNIRINRYEIPVGASYEDIARIITTKPQY